VAKISSRKRSILYGFGKSSRLKILEEENRILKQLVADFRLGE
jgi:hypothetical protein